MSKIIQITRNYNNPLEEGRIRLGHKFAVGKPVDGLRLITEGRASQLLDAGMAREWRDGLPPVLQTPTPNYPGQLRQPRSVDLGIIKNQQRTVAKVREAAPPAPLPLASPAGGKTGAKPSASSSEAARASTNVPSIKRGNRRSKSSPSTTPTKSSHGPQSSTPATEAGGDSTAAAQTSKA